MDGITGRRHDMSSFTRSEKTLIIVFFVLSLLFISIIPVRTAVPGLYVLKDLPDITLAVLALIAIAGARGKILFAAYVLCALAGLALDLPIEASFVLGLLLFLLGHLGYITTFLLDFQWRPRRLWIVALILIYAAGMAVLFTPFLGALQVPVYCYMAVLSMMCIISTQRKATNNFVIFGALLFMASDSVLASNKFIGPIAGEVYIVMFTYYAAQFFILYGFLKDKYRKSA
jgi:uncharacterized membrane protein YhhN